MDLEEVTLVGGMNYTVHAKNDCTNEWCFVHNPSDHHMRKWTQYWNKDREVMERVCPHNIGHPDPDDPKMIGEHKLPHTCDGCCDPKNWKSD